MGKRVWAGLAIATALAVAPSGCRKGGETSAGAAPADSSAEVPFTPPEVRREAAREDAVPVEAVSEAPTPVAPLPATAPSPKPVPPAVSVAPPQAAPSASKPAPVAVAASAPSTAKVVAPSGSGDWVLQVGIHKSEASAQAAVDRLGSKGIPAYVLRVGEGADLSGSYWRVRVGRFESRSDAEAYARAKLPPLGLSWWVDRKSREATGTP